MMLEPGSLIPHRAVFPECPRCDRPVELSGISLNEQVVCPYCGVSVLLVRIDGILMFLREGWT